MAGEVAGESKMTTLESLGLYYNIRDSDCTVVFVSCQRYIS